MSVRADQQPDLPQMFAASQAERGNSGVGHLLHRVERHIDARVVSEDPHQLHSISLPVNGADRTPQLDEGTISHQDVPATPDASPAGPAAPHRVVVSAAVYPRD